MVRITDTGPWSQAFLGVIMAAVVDKEKCTGCGDCTEACPSNAITVQEEKANVSADDCIDCGACVDACPNTSISMG